MYKHKYINIYVRHTPADRHVMGNIKCGSTRRQQPQPPWTSQRQRTPCHHVSRQPGAVPGAACIPRLRTCGCNMLPNVVCNMLRATCSIESLGYCSCHRAHITFATGEEREECGARPEGGRDSSHFPRIFARSMLN